MFGPFSGLLWDAGGGGGGGGVRFQGSKGERWEETSFLVFARRVVPSCSVRKDRGEVRGCACDLSRAHLKVTGLG